MELVRRLSLVLVLAAALFGGCNGPERVILIDVYSQASVANLNVRVISLAGLGAPYVLPATEFSPARSAAELLDTPIRVAIRLGGETTAMVHFTARSDDGRTLVATRCYGVTGAVRDEVVLVDVGTLDGDGDSFLTDPSEACREPTDGDTAGRPCDPTDLHICPLEATADCNDEPPTVPPNPVTEERCGAMMTTARREELRGFCIHPGATTVCQNGIDEDCDGADEVCLDEDGDGVNACAEGETAGCDCDDDNPSINPRAEDICLDGIDQDCQGGDACCDADGDGFVKCGVDGTTTDCVDVPADCLGQVPPCDPTMVIPSEVHPDATEACFDGIDNNCNGVQNEIGACLGPDFDRDGVLVCGMESPGQPCEEREYDCDAAISPNARERCRPVGIDEDLDGMVDEGCAAGDRDGDGQVAPRDCDDTDPLAYTHDAGDPVVERCDDGVAQSCVPGGDVACVPGDTDGDGFVEPAECEGDASINPDQMEICDGIDNNCDGVVDEVLDLVGLSGCGFEGVVGMGGMASGRLDFQTDIEHCGSCRFNCDDEFRHDFGSAVDQCRGGVCDCSTEGSMMDPGACALGDHPTCCADGCQDTAVDPLNCGGCGVVCGTGEACVMGRCGCGTTVASRAGEQACPDTVGITEDNQCCSEMCTMVTTDGSNCGICGTACGPTTICDNRICACDPASPSMDDCNLDIGAPGGNGCETNLLTTRAHCGRCGSSCNPANANGACVSGSCTIASCNTDFDDCDGLVGNGCETSLRSLTNCDACGVLCDLSGAMATCARRVCEIASCGGAFADCNGSDADGCETALGTVSNCASCGDRCNLANATPRCNSGRNCVIQSCDDGWMDCDGVPSNGCEVNIDTNANCGSCGNGCGSNASCMSRACVCDPGRLDCTAGSPYCEILYGVSNCGDCGATCGLNETCAGSGDCSCGGTLGGMGAGAVCTGNQRCCGTSCRTLGTTSNCSDCGNGCRTNETCNGSGPWACRCGGGLRCFGADSCCPSDGGCVNTNEDEANCGGCGITCAAGEVCNGGTCECGGGSTWEPACTGANVCCAAAGCLTLGSDANCSTCGDNCTVPETCGGGGAALMCGCTPTTCGALGLSCGSAPNGCGGTLSCGSCSTNEACNVGTCECVGGFGDCTGASGCETTLGTDANCSMCGDNCSSPQTCGGGGAALMCGCTPTTCGALGLTCGPAPDGCGGTLSCGSCSTNETCNVGTCECEAGFGDCTGASGCETTLGTDANCSMCGDSCSSPQTCGGGGMSNVCGCTPTTCGALGLTCGPAPDGCGGTLSCGSCSTNETCNVGTCECEAGFGDCTAAEGCETPLGTDMNCSMCGDNCTGLETCGGGGTPDVCGS